MATTKPIYEDFEPHCKWQRGETADALELHLEGFRKDQLKVQINNAGTIMVSGERAIDDNKRSRFHKEIRGTQDYKRQEIHAKFASGKLIITLPKKIATLVDNTGEITASGTKGSMKRLVSRLKMSKMKALNVTVGVAVLVGLAAYIYKYCQCGSVEN